jgi:D-3-phosphoglycerate dehydrogenase
MNKKWRVLVSEPVAQEGLDILRAHDDIEVIFKPELKADALLGEVADVHGLIVRSQTKVTAQVIAAGKNLQVIARAGVGVDNIDVPAATRRGIVVLNSPDGNTIAAAEQTIALLLALSRNLPQAHASLSAGEWKRSAFMGVEVYGKVLGLIGLGKVGTHMARMARGLEMEIIACDPYISREHAERLGVRLVGFEELLRQADYISLHVSLTKDTRGMIGAKELAMMKPGVRIINTSRGGVIDEGALAEAIRSGHVAGAALDVFENEPPKGSPVVGLPGVIVTPHLGAATEEAQVKVAVDVAAQLADVLHGLPARTAVNLPPVSAETLKVLRPYLTLAEKIGRLQVQLAAGAITSIEVIYSGEIAELDVSTVTRALLKGLLERALEESVNYVNAVLVAETRGIRVTEAKSTSAEDYASLIAVKASSESGSREIEGTVFGAQDIRITRVDGYRVDFVPQGNLLITTNQDRPGMIGRVGTILGDAGINIAGMYVGRDRPGGREVMVLAVDSPVPAQVREKVLQVDGVESIHLAEL